MIFLFLSTALAGSLLERPPAGAPVKGQCNKVYPVQKDKPFPFEVTGQDGTPNCYAVLVPLSDYSDLLTTEAWATSIAQQYQIDTSVLQSDLDRYKGKLELETKPDPWIERPATQRWIGRIETLIVVAIATAGLGATYHYASGAGK